MIGWFATCILCVSVYNYIEAAFYFPTRPRYMCSETDDYLWIRCNPRGYVISNRFFIWICGVLWR